MKTLVVEKVYWDLKTKTCPQYFKIMEFIKILTPVSSFLLVIITGIYVILTYRLILENRKLREMQISPKVSVSYEPHKDNIALINLVIKNVGLGPAYDIKFEITPDIKGYNGKAEKLLSEYAFFKKGIKYLAPAQEVRHFLNYLGKMSKKEIETNYSGKIYYKDASGKEHKDDFSIDFSYRKDLTIIEEKTIRDILKDIEKHIESLAKQKFR